MKRDNSLDSLKYLAMMEVIFIHFMYFFDESLLLYIRSVIPYSLVFKGLSAKFGLAVLAVISGYFSCLNKKDKKFIPYFIKKYLYYFFYCFVANLIYCLIDHDHQFGFSFPDILIKSLLLKEDYYYYLWFIRFFFIGNIVSFLIGRFSVPVHLVMILFFVLTIFDMQYVAVFLIGCMLSALMDREGTVLDNKYIHCIFVLLIFLLPKIETGYAYTLYGTCGGLLMILSRKNGLFHKLLENGSTSFYGKITMPILIVHFGCMYIFERMELLPLILIYVLWLSIVHIAAYLLSIPVNFINRCAIHLTDDVYCGIMSGVKADE